MTDAAADAWSQARIVTARVRRREPERSMSTVSPLGARRAILNVSTRWGAHAFSLVVSFFLTPFVVSRLGDSSYGLWTLLASLTGYLGLADIGVRSAVTRYVAKFRAEAGHDEVSRIVSSALLIFSGAAALTLVASVGLAFLAVDHFQIPADARGTARLVLVLIGVNVAVALVSGVFGGVIAGLQRFDVLNLVEMGIIAARAVIIVAVLGAGGGLVALAVVHLILALGRGLADAVLSRRLYPEVRARLLASDHASLRLIFSHGLWAFLVHVSSQLIYHTDSVVIGLFLPVSSITFFAIATNLVRQVGALAGGIRYTLGPLASTLEATRHPSLSRVALDAARYCTAVVLPVYVTFVLRGQSFIGLWMGPEYAGPSGAVLAVLTLGSAFGAGPGALGVMVIGIGRHRMLAFALLAEALGNLLLSVELVRPFGVVGVAWGTTIPLLAMSWLFWPWFARRTLDIAPARYVTSMWGRPAVATIPFALLTWAIERWWPAPGLALFFVQVALALPVAVVCLWGVCVPRPDRARLQRHLVDAGLAGIRRLVRSTPRPSER